MNMINNYYQTNPYRNNQIGIEELNNRVLRFHFLNGNIDFVEGNYGAYAISSGCGSGKTTNIKNLIDLRWYEGVLYAAFTKEEINEMYQFILHELVGKSIDPHTGEILKIEDVLVLHSDFMAPGVDMNLFRNHPEELANKKVVLCTHAKLLDEPLEILLATKFNQRIAKSMLPPLNNVVTGLCDSYPRQWVIIDEGIEAREKVYDILPETFPALGELANTERQIDYSLGYKRYVTVDLPTPKLVRKFNIYDDFVKNINGYSEYVVGRSLLGINPSNEINTIKFHQVATELFNNFEMYAVYNKVKGSTKISFNYTNMIMSGMKLHLLLFDGTSDLTLSTSGKFSVLGISGNKYNSQVNLSLFPFNLNRKLKINEVGVDPDAYIRSELDKIADNLESIVRQNQKTLIFTWRNFKSGNEEANDDIDDGSMAQKNSNLVINNNMSIPSYISMRLSEKGLVEGVNFSIEYYGSGKDKAVNCYRDYDSVVLLGRYNVPNSAISDFNRIYDADMTGTEYYANRVIQAICRSRIRLHNGLPINVYMSSDWSSDVINKVSLYLNITKASSSVALDINKVNEAALKLKSLGVTPSRAGKIAKLCAYNSNIYRSITNGEQYSCVMTLDEIYSVLPMSQKKCKEYNSIIGILGRYGIHLTLLSS